MSSYIKLHHNKRLKEIKNKIVNMLSPCCICPRKCGVNRLEDEQGFCKSGRKVVVSSYGAHSGEEPPISGYKGSGTIFLGNCNLNCVFCQNYQISQELQTNSLYELEAEELAKIMIKLQNKNCHNINFVSPSHFVPQIVEALEIAIEMGLEIPLVYNSNGYDDLNVIQMLDGIFDIYMPDFKYGGNSINEAFEYSKAPSYAKYAKIAIKEMHRQVGILEMDRDGIAIKGLLIRHLILPNNKALSNKVLEYIANEIDKDTYISLMAQYYPCYKSSEFEEINRSINSFEYDKTVDYFHSLGLNNGWIQDLKHSPYYYRPDFDNKKVFEDW